MDNQPQVNFTTSACDSLDLSKWMLWSMIPAGAIFTLFCFLEQRVRLWPTCCQGRPGVAYPANMVDSYSDRWSFAFAFGSMSAAFVHYMFKSSGIGIDFFQVTEMLQGTVEFFFAMAQGLVISLVFYPILLCLRTKWTLLGNTIGWVYSCIWLSNYITRAVFGCGMLNIEHQEIFLIMMTIGGYGSGIVCFSALTIRFTIGLVKDITSGIKLHLKPQEVAVVDFTKTHFYQRVKFLLTPPVAKDESGNIIVRLFQRYIGTVPGFRFSRRNICSLVLTVVATIEVVLLYMYLFGEAFQLASQELADLQRYPDNQLKKWTEILLKDLETTFWITCVIAIIFAMVYTIDMQLRYRKHTVKLWKGDRSFCPDDKFSFGTMLVSSLRYSGYQVAFTVWGFIIMQLLLWTVSLIIILAKDTVLWLIKRYWLTLAITYGFYYGQIFISRLICLQKAPASEQSRYLCTRETYLGLDNRRVFHVTAYITLFINFLLGLLSCFLRIFTAIGFGTLFIGRLDRCILMRGWELWDIGYRAYIGFLELEVAHTHPVLITFCHFLLKTIHSGPAEKGRTVDLVSIVSAEADGAYEEGPRSNGGFHPRSPGAPSSGQVSRQIRNKWLVALTLARNPKLALERKMTLMEMERPRTTSSISLQVPQRDHYVAGETDA